MNFRVVEDINIDREKRYFVQVEHNDIISWQYLRKIQFKGAPFFTQRSTAKNEDAMTEQECNQLIKEYKDHMQSPKEERNLKIIKELKL